MPQQFAGNQFCGIGVGCLHLGAEAHRAFATALSYNLVQAHKGASTNKQNFVGAHLNVLLMGVLATALRWHVANRPLQNLEQRLLHTFPAHISGNRHVLRLAPDFVDFVNVNNPDLCALHVVFG